MIGVNSACDASIRGFARPAVMSSRRFSTRSPDAVIPSCSHPLVIHVRSDPTEYAAASDSLVGTYMSWWWTTAAIGTALEPRRASGTRQAGAVATTCRRGLVAEDVADALALDLLDPAELVCHRVGGPRRHNPG
ncbi:hypothetical protein [Saccharothrix deserti]|uniref:hypothetical protein n=1 Tax=Saccharothrix deserti TaxID=2593674 RepID=UPI00131AC4BC|nr:hypothetical protein [Saccharothrix deserti]